VGERCGRCSRDNADIPLILACGSYLDDDSTCPCVTFRRTPLPNGRARYKDMRRNGTMTA
jgi:hypothetical protein